MTSRIKKDPGKKEKGDRGSSNNYLLPCVKEGKKGGDHPRNPLSLPIKITAPEGERDFNEREKKGEKWESATPQRSRLPISPLNAT